MEDLPQVLGSLQRSGRSVRRLWSVAPNLEGPAALAEAPCLDGEPKQGDGLPEERPIPAISAGAGRLRAALAAPPRSHRLPVVALVL